MAVLPIGIGAEEGGYQIERSLRFNSADSADLNRTFGTPTDNNRCTISVWVKKTTNSAGPLDFGFLTTGVNTSVVGISGTGAYGASLDNKIFVRNNDTNKDYWYPVLRDNSAWYHIVIAINTDESTQADRAKLWINGVSQAANKQASGFSLSEALTFNTASTVHRIGSIGSSYSTYYANGYLAEYYFVDGQALDASYFGETNTDTGVWQPKAYTGSYGTNGFYLDFADNSSTTALGYDAAGSNDWTPNNFSVTAGAGNDSLVDTPTNYGTDTGVGGEVRGNYATWNGVSIGADATLTNGNLDIAYGSSGTRNATMGTFGMSSGKWYWEVTITASSASPTAAVIGITNEPSASAVSNYPGFAANGWGYSGSDANKYNNGSGTAYGATFAANDVIGFAFDADAGSITAYKNGVSQGVMFSSLAANTYYPAIGDGSALSTFSASANFGQRPFAYSAPSGFASLCTQNLPEPTVVDGGEYFDALLWTGDGSQTRSLTGIAFQPDFTWMKSRSVVQEHQLYDVVRGAGGGKMLCSNLTAQEGQDGSGNSDSQYGYLSSFDSGGFSVDDGSVATTGGWVNYSGRTYVAWNWKANGAGVSNTDGTITSTVSANTTSGFSIITHSGTGSNGTIGHGLGVAPQFVLTKRRSAAEAWTGWHVSLSGGTYNIELNTTNAQQNSPTHYTAVPTSTVINLGTNTASNASGSTYVTYAFAPVAGFSAFGSYTGNGSSDGPFIYTGFRPRFILIKRSSDVDDWFVYDTARSPYNAMTYVLSPNSSAADTATTNPDALSNGFKLRSTSGGTNASGGTYIYAAFSEVGFKYALGR